VKPGPTARAALVLVAFLAVFTVVDRMSTTGGGATRTAAAPPAAQEPDTSAAATTTTVAPTTATTRAPTTTTAAPTTTTKGTTKSTLRPASGVSVQVLNGVWVTGLAHRVAGQVRAAGYDVVAAKTALGSYSVSRVYYTGGHRADAEAFKDRFPAFSVVEPAPANLSRRVALHVVIGKDYPGV
jgi:hypothetical protein